MTRQSVAQRVADSASGPPGAGTAGPPLARLGACFVLCGGQQDVDLLPDAGRRTVMIIWELDPLIHIYKYHRYLKGEISISSLTRYRYLYIDIYIESDVI